MRTTCAPCSPRAGTRVTSRAASTPAILLVFIDTGVRLSELGNLRVALDETENDVDLDQGVVG